MDEARLVLDAIHDRLAREPVDVISPLTDEGDVLTLLAGKVEIAVVIRHDEGAHPAIAHAHVLVTLRGEAPLVASVVAVHADRAKGLAGVGETFCDVVAGPVFSFVHGRPVMNAVAFDPTGPDGVRGQRGFVGPRLVRGLADGAPDPFEGVPTFDYAEALAPPGPVHIAKVVFDVRSGQRIRRTIEVDGHAASHVDGTWAPDRSPPANIVGLRYAVFHAPDRPAQVRRHRALDEAIEAFVEHFAATRERDAAADRLATSGVDPRLVHEIRLFVPAAFARLVFEDRLPLSTTFTRVRKDGWVDEGLPFMRERPFARATVLGTTRIERDGVQLAQEIAMTASEVAAIQHSLQQGTP
ncbi:MAG: hypothetical protein AAF602_18720, partial [Myxococcota bacterium]